MGGSARQEGSVWVTCAPAGNGSLDLILELPSQKKRVMIMHLSVPVTTPKPGEINTSKALGEYDQFGCEV
jgi:hypothetical protein